MSGTNYKISDSNEENCMSKSKKIQGGSLNGPSENRSSENGPSGEPIIPATVSLPEITLRVIVLGVILTVVLAAANAYLGLKVGTTVSASIPAAVISMGILRFFRNSNILENTMVQTMASVGESLTAGIAFITPALVILHAWDRFYYWQLVAAGLVGGTFGVLFTIPIRRALLVDKTLRYPEGVAIGNVLKASANKEKGDLTSLTFGGIVGGLIALCQTGFQVIADYYQYWFQTSSTVFGFGIGLSPALIAAGYIVGINVAISVLVGVLIGWIAGVPILTWIYGIPNVDTATDMAVTIWRAHIRYIGVGTMLIGSLWTLITLIKPIFRSIVSSFDALAKNKVNGGRDNILRTERDVPMNLVGWAALILLVPAFLLIANSVIPATAPISQGFRYFLSGFGAVYILIAGFVFCSVTAYFAGLVGSTNSPISGMLVSSLIILCLILTAIFSAAGTFAQIGSKETIGVVIAIGCSVIISAGLAISNDTMQDLKVGQIVGATPWKQQLMLILGVIVASFVIPPILDLLYNAYGIGGAFPRPGMDPAQMLSAPQAGLMAAVAQGIFNHNLEWTMIMVGVVVAVIGIIIDESLKKIGHRLPVLAVGLGIYLQQDSSVPLIIGGFLSYLVHYRLSRMYDQRKPEQEKQMTTHRHRGLLLCCGIVAGASVMGVLLAIPFAIKQSANALRIMPDQFQSFAGVLGIIVTFMLCAWIYRVVMKRA
jgi:putative OPT family oligopeptide transporter